MATSICQVTREQRFQSSEAISLSREREHIILASFSLLEHFSPWWGVFVCVWGKGYSCNFYFHTLRVCPTVGLWNWPGSVSVEDFLYRERTSCLEGGLPVLREDFRSWGRTPCLEGGLSVWGDAIEGKTRHIKMCLLVVYNTSKDLFKCLFYSLTLFHTLQNIDPGINWTAHSR